MKKQILNLGKALNKAEQKDVFGGTPLPDLDPNDGLGGGSGSGGSNCNGLDTLCSPGKCFSLTSCRCQYGQGEGPSMNGVCIN